jgi:hypothetical protein
MTTTSRPAHIDTDCKGTNKKCKAARKAGRPVHIIPPAIDGEPWLILPTYHYATELEAACAVVDANAHAPLVTCDDELYDFRARGIAHKIPRGFIDPTRR